MRTGLRVTAVLVCSRHSSFWEPQAAERAPEPEEAVPWDDGALPPSPSASSPPPEEDGRPGLVGAARRPRISLCAVMRSISQMETPENLGEPLGGEVSARGRGTAGLQVGDGGCGGNSGTHGSFWRLPLPQVSEGAQGLGDTEGLKAAPLGPRPRSRPCRVVRQASVDGDGVPAEEHSPTEGSAPTREPGPPGAP